MSQPKRASGSNLVAAGILLSRIAGIVRTVVVSSVLGAGSAAEAFNFAMRIPNVLQNLLGEGSLSASFIPVYAKLVEDGKEDEAGALASSVLSFLALVTGLLVLLGVLAARPILWLLTDWESDRAKFELAIDLFRITTVGIGILVISAWCLGVLNSHRSFFLSYAAPVAWNLVQITVLVFAAVVAWTDTGKVMALAWAVVAGGALQVAVQLPKVRRLVPTVRPSLNRSDAVRDVGRRFVPAVGARGVVQLSSFLDSLFLAFIASKAVSLYVYALPLYITPISIFGFSVAAAELAEMSRKSDQLDALAARIKPALRRVIIPTGFVTAAYLAAGPIWTDALYGWLPRLFNKSLEEPSIRAIGYLLMAMAVGLPAAITARVTQNTLYSMGDVKGPARIAVVRLIVGAVASIALMLQFDWLTFSSLDAGAEVTQFGSFPHWPIWERLPECRRNPGSVNCGLDPELVPPHLGIIGIGLGSAVAAWTEWVLLRLRLRSKLGSPASNVVSSGWGRQVTVAAAAAGAAMWGLYRLTSQTDVPSPLDAVITAVIGLAIYASILWIQGVRSLSGLPSKP